MAPRVLGVEPIFFVADVARALEHYARLGFAADVHDETYAFASWGDLVIHLAFDDGAARTAAIYVHVDDATQVANEWRAAGADVVGPEDFEYGKREGSHRDPDGNVIRFGSALPAAPA